MTGKAQHELKIEKWSEIVQARKSSGLTVSQWCQENGINEKNYYRWQRIITRENADSGEEPQTGKAQFAEIIYQGIAKGTESAEITVIAGKWTVNIRNKANPELVCMVLKAIPYV